MIFEEKLIKYSFVIAGREKIEVGLFETNLNFSFLSEMLIAAKNLPRWYSKICFEFHCCDCI